MPTPAQMFVYRRCNMKCPPGSSPPFPDCRLKRELMLISLPLCGLLQLGSCSKVGWLGKRQGECPKAVLFFAWGLQVGLFRVFWLLLQHACVCVALTVTCAYVCMHACMHSCLCLCVCVLIHLVNCLSIYLSISVIICVSDDLSIDPSICLFVCLSLG